MHFFGNLTWSVLSCPSAIQEFADAQCHTGHTPVLSKVPNRKKKDDLTPSRWPKSRKRAEAPSRMIVVFQSHMAACFLKKWRAKSFQATLFVWVSYWEAVKGKNIDLLKDIQHRVREFAISKKTGQQELAKKDRTMVLPNDEELNCTLPGAHIYYI